MRDLVFVAIALALFGLSYLYVLGCDRIIGRGTPAVGGAEPDISTASTDSAEAAVSS